MKKFLTGFIIVLSLVSLLSSCNKKQGTGDNKKPLQKAKQELKEKAKHVTNEATQSQKQTKSKTSNTQTKGSGWYNVSSLSAFEFDSLFRVNVAKSFNSDLVKNLHVQELLNKNQKMEKFKKCMGVKSVYDTVDHLMVISSKKQKQQIFILELTQNIDSDKFAGCMKDPKTNPKAGDITEITIGGKKAFANNKDHSVMVFFDKHHVILTGGSLKDPKLLEKNKALLEKVIPMFPLCPKIFKKDKPSSHTVWGYSKDVKDILTKVPGLEKVKVGEVQGYLDVNKDLFLKIMAELGNENDAKQAAEVLQKELQTKLMPQLSMVGLQNLVSKITVKQKKTKVCLKLTLTQQEVAQILAMAKMMLMGSMRGGAMPMKRLGNQGNKPIGKPMNNKMSPMMPNLKLKMKMKGPKGIKGLKKLSIMK